MDDKAANTVIAATANTPALRLFDIACVRLRVRHYSMRICITEGLVTPCSFCSEISSG